MASAMYRIGQKLEGRLGPYVITQVVQNTVWFAKNQRNEPVVVKSVKDHPRVENERQLLRRFAGHPHLRPLVDEVHNVEHTTIVLKHLDNHLLNATIAKALSRKELKYVLRCVLQGLVTLHEAGFIHTDVKPDNVLVNYNSEGGNRFSDVSLGDLGGTCHVTSEFAKTGTPVGAPIWTSPEVLMAAPWDAPTNIWSFGIMVSSVETKPSSHARVREEYELEVFKHQFRYFGPFPGSIGEAISEVTAEVILYLMKEIPYSQTGLFQRITEKEVCKADKAFVCRIMRMDWRERPMAKELLKDDWILEP